MVAHDGPWLAPAYWAASLQTEVLICNSWAIVSLTHSFGSTRAYLAYLPFASKFPLNFFSLKDPNFAVLFPPLQHTIFSSLFLWESGFFDKSRPRFFMILSFRWEKGQSPPQSFRFSLVSTPTFRFRGILAP